MHSAALDKAKGPSIAARARCVPWDGVSEHYRAAHGVEQRKAIDSGGAAVNGAHGAGCGDVEQLPFAFGAAHAFQPLLDRLLGAGHAVHHRENLRLTSFAGANLAMPIGFAFANMGNNLVCSIYQDKSGCAFAAPLTAHIIGHFRSFLTIRADYSSGVNSVYKQTLYTVSSGQSAILSVGAKLRGKAPCQYRKYARSGRAADAVREHSFFAALAATSLRSIVTPARSAPDARSPLFLSSLTPARSYASSLARQISAPDGWGGAVLWFQLRNRCQNQQAIEIITNSSLVLRFSLSLARYACARSYVHPCAYMRARKAGTLEPNEFIYSYQIDVGSVVGSSAGTLEPEAVARVKRRGFLRFSSKIVGRYCSAGAEMAAQGLDARGRWRKLWAFLVERLIELVEGGDRGSCGELGASISGALALTGQSDGFLRVSAGRARRVGMLPLEWNAERRSLPCIFALRPLPIGKARRAGRAHALGTAGTPPIPPSPVAAQSISMPRDAGQNLEGLSALNHIGTWRCRQRRAARTGWRTMGSGERILRHGNPPIAGRGRSAAGKLRRFGQASGSMSHVN